MSKNEMLGHYIRSKPNSNQFDESDFHKEFLQLIREFKVDVNNGINTVSDSSTRAMLLGSFNKHIVRLENKLYSLKEEIK